MIISRTPFRVSFVGGGTDLPSFYTREAGAVISTTIDKYVYITVNRRFDSTLRVSYSQTEIVDRVEGIHHPLFRETMKETGVDSGIEVTSIADVPSGTGLGSSSSFTVGLFHALRAFGGRFQTAADLAEQACRLEIECLKEPIGKQDQYAAAFGGLRRYIFNTDNTVFVDPVICTPETRANLFGHLLLFYLGGTRNASDILQEQSNLTDQKIEHLRKLRGLVDRFWDVLTRKSDLREIGELLHDGWECKKHLACKISNASIDEYYDRARRAGSLGGKVLGAGSSGFLLLFCEPAKMGRVRESLRDLREISFRYEPEGSKIIYVGS
jgi:D-glycero-alpha-D-manno-heptose-7-phosphate kinase